MKIWETPMEPSGSRSLELVRMLAFGTRISIVLLDERSRFYWTLEIPTLHALCVTAEPSSASLLEGLPGHGGFWRTSESAWLERLGLGSTFDGGDLEHFLIRCNDEVLEFIASLDAPTFARDPFEAI